MSAAHPPPPPVPAAPVAGVSALGIGIGDLGYAPSQVVVAPGTTLRWRNEGRNRHTATAEDGSFDSGTMVPGATFSITAPAGRGTVAYRCTIHAFMRGTLTVSDLTLGGPATVPAGGRAAVSGVLPGAPAGSEVVVERREAGAWREVARGETDAAGAYAARTPPLARGAALRARAGERLSPALRVGVTPHLHAHLMGARAHLHGRPAAPGAAVSLERLNLDTYRWRPVARLRLSRAGTAAVPLAAPGVYRFAVAPAAGLAGARSSALRHRPYAFRA